MPIQKYMKVLSIVMRSKQILIISPEQWNGHFVSKHHYAITLANQGAKVYFLNPPDDTLSDIYITETAYKNLCCVSSAKVAKGLRFYPKFLKKILEKRWLQKLETKIKIPFTSVWLFENSRFYDMSFAGVRTKIYHQVDSNQNFHLKKASSTADICFGVTDFIQKELSNYNKRIFKISHGLNEAHQNISLHLKYKKNFMNNTIHALYMGNLEMLYLNKDLLYKLTYQNPKVTFHFLGTYSPTGILFQLCKNQKNIIWWNKVNSEDILSILEKVDMTLVLYKSEEYKEQLANSHKIMEYLSSGKVTIATYTDEYKDKRYLLEMLDISDKYLEKFQEVLANLDFYNSKEKQEERRIFASENTYEKQVLKILNHLKRYNLKL
jgi:hypothetical protein